MASTCSKCVPDWSRLWQMISTLSWSPPPLWIYEDGHSVEVQTWTVHPFQVTCSESWTQMFWERIPFGQSQHSQLIFSSSNQVLFLSILVFFIHRFISSHQYSMFFSRNHYLSQPLNTAFWKITNVDHSYQTSHTGSHHDNNVNYRRHVLPFCFIATVRHENLEEIQYIFAHFVASKLADQASTNRPQNLHHSLM